MCTCMHSHTRTHARSISVHFLHYNLDKAEKDLHEYRTLIIFALTHIILHLLCMQDVGKNIQDKATQKRQDSKGTFDIFY